MVPPHFPLSFHFTSLSESISMLRIAIWAVCLSVSSVVAVFAVPQGLPVEGACFWILMLVGAASLADYFFVYREIRLREPLELMSQSSRIMSESFEQESEKAKKLLADAANRALRNMHTGDDATKIRMLFFLLQVRLRQHLYQEALEVVNGLIGQIELVPYMCNRDARLVALKWKVIVLLHLKDFDGMQSLVEEIMSKPIHELGAFGMEAQCWAFETLYHSKPRNTEMVERLQLRYDLIRSELFRNPAPPGVDDFQKLLVRWW